MTAGSFGRRDGNVLRFDLWDGWYVTYDMDTHMVASFEYGREWGLLELDEDAAADLAARLG